LLIFVTKLNEKEKYLSLYHNENYRIKRKLNKIIKKLLKAERTNIENCCNEKKKKKTTFTVKQHLCISSNRRFCKTLTTREHYAMLVKANLLEL